MSKFLLKVLSVIHWTDTLFSFQIERPKDFKFKSGEFVMIGLPNSDKPILRAYSICSPNWDEKLEQQEKSYLSKSWTLDKKILLA